MPFRGLKYAISLPKICHFVAWLRNHWDRYNFKKDLKMYLSLNDSITKFDILYLTTTFLPLMIYRPFCVFVILWPFSL